MCRQKLTERMKPSLLILMRYYHRGFRLTCKCLKPIHYTYPLWVLIRRPRWYLPSGIGPNGQEPERRLHQARYGPGYQYALLYCLDAPNQIDL